MCDDMVDPSDSKVVACHHSGTLMGFVLSLHYKKSIFTVFNVCFAKWRCAPEFGSNKVPIEAHLCTILIYLRYVWPSRPVCVCPLFIPVTPLACYVMAALLFYH